MLERITLKRGARYSGRSQTRAPTSHILRSSHTKYLSSQLPGSHALLRHLSQTRVMPLTLVPAFHNLNEPARVIAIQIALLPTNKHFEAKGIPRRLLASTPSPLLYGFALQLAPVIPKNSQRRNLAVNAYPHYNRQKHRYGRASHYRQYRRCLLWRRTSSKL